MTPPNRLLMLAFCTCSLAVVTTTDPRKRIFRIPEKKRIFRIPENEMKNENLPLWVKKNENQNTTAEHKNIVNLCIRSEIDGDDACKKTENDCKKKVDECWDDYKICVKEIRICTSFSTECAIWNIGNPSNVVIARRNDAPPALSTPLHQQFATTAATTMKSKIKQFLETTKLSAFKGAVVEDAVYMHVICNRCLKQEQKCETFHQKIPWNALRIESDSDAWEAEYKKGPFRYPVMPT